MVSSSVWVNFSIFYEIFVNLRKFRRRPSFYFKWKYLFVKGEFLMRSQINSLSLVITVSTSSFVLCLLNEKRTVTRLGLLLMARMTCEAWSAPLVHALPPDAQI